MFEKYRKKAEKVKDLLSSRKVASLVGTSLMCLGLIGGKVHAQEVKPPADPSIRGLDKVELGQTKSSLLKRDISFLKSETTPEEEINIDRLHERLNAIKKIKELSASENTNSLSLEADEQYGSIQTGVSTLFTKTEAYYFNNSDNNNFTDIITHNNSVSINYNVNKITKTYTTQTPARDTILSASSFVALEDENGNYRTLLPNVPGYINEDGSENTLIRQSRARVNESTERNYSRNDIIPKEVIDKFNKEGLTNRDLLNDVGYTRQGLTNTQLGNSTTKKSIERDFGLSFNHTDVIKKTSSSPNSTRVRESIRNTSYNQNSRTPLVDTLINGYSLAIQSPLKKDLEEAKNQHFNRITGGSSILPEDQGKPARVHNMNVLPKIDSLKNNIANDISPNISESVIVLEKQKPSAIFSGAYIGSREVLRQKKKYHTILTEKSNFTNVMLQGGETDLGQDTNLIVNGEQLIRDGESISENGKNAFASIQFTLDQQDYVIENKHTSILTKVAEPQVGISAGIQHKDLGLAVRTGFGYDGSEKKLYPTISLFSQLGDSNSSNLTVSGEYSTHPGISNPNQVQIAASVPVTLHEKKTQDYSTPNYIQTITKPASAEVEGSQKKLVRGVSDRFVIKPYFSKEIDLGGNDAAHKTSFKAGLTALYSRKTAHLRDDWNSDKDISNDYTLGSTQIGATIEKTLKATENSNEGYLLKAFVRRNWLTIQAVLSKLNNTNTYSIGASAHINNSLSMDGSYSQSNRPGDLFDDSTVKLNLRYTH